MSRKIKSDIYCSGIQIINPYKINKIVKNTTNFNKVWAKLIEKKKLKVSDVLPRNWFTIDNPNQLKTYLKKFILMFDLVLVAVFTYNEENKISEVLEKMCKKFKNILVVDNNSQDNTLKMISNYPVKCIHHKYNLGKSNSMKTALDYARINNFEYLAFIDGDGQHSILI